jgi:hypothetical protein
MGIAVEKRRSPNKPPYAGGLPAAVHHIALLRLIAPLDSLTLVEDARRDPYSNDVRRLPAMISQA